MNFEEFKKAICERLMKAKNEMDLIFRLSAMIYSLAGDIKKE